jgi:hypothetical protein
MASHEQGVDASGRGPQSVVMVTCAECGKLSSRYWLVWRTSRSDDPDLDGPPALAFYCNSCAGQELNA